MKLVLWVFIFIILTLLSLKRDNDHYDKMLFVIEIILILLCALREIPVHSSNDTFTYQKMFLDALNNDLSDYFLMYIGTEKFYLLLNYIISHIGIPFRVFLIATSIISVGGPLYMFNRLSKNPSFSVLIYMALGCYFINYSTIRQCMAIGIICYGITKLLEEKYFQYAICVGIACLFHISSIVMYVLIFYKKINYNKKNIVFSLAFVVLCFIALQFFSFLLPWKYTAYVSQGFNLRIPVIIQIIWYIFQFVIGLLFIKYTNIKSESIQLSTFTYQIQCILEIISLKIDMISRVALFFIPINCIYLPNIINVDKRTKIYYLLSFLFLIYMICWLLMNKQMNYI